MPLQTVKRLSRMDTVQSPMIAIVGDLIRQTPGTISLGQGVVHYGPPREAVEAAARAAAGPEVHQYQPLAGVPALLEAIEQKVGHDNGIDLARGCRIMVTAGGNMAFVHAVVATTMPGDEIILTVPFYFNHEMAVEMAGCRAVRVPTDPQYQLDVDAIRAAVTPRTRAVVTISPNNPTGAVYGPDALRAVNELCRDLGLYHISDEAYEYFVYGSAVHASPASFADAAGHTISLYSLSKSYGMAGWRVGYMVYPEALSDAFAKVQDTVLICPPVICQLAAAAALSVGRAYCRPYVAGLAAVRDVVFAALRTLEPLCTVPAAEGAFYCCLRANVSANPMRVVERLVREHRVAVIPATTFGLVDGCYFRVAYGALDQATVTAGIGRLVDGLRAILTSADR
jgi:aspartate/methionine/tyrosine aminotransferase